MSTAASLQNLVAKPKALSNSTYAGLLLQRKCACGSPTASLTGECAECTSKKRLQTSLAIGASNDPLEREADRVADQVLAAPANPAASGTPPRIQRFTGHESGPADSAPASVDHALAGPGRPLEAALRQDMQQRFGHDFSRVRVHSGAAAEQSARDINAHAYTVGDNIVFGAGRLAPATHDGQRLIAHELTHVVQQSGSVGFLDGRQDSSPVTNAAPARRELQRDEAEGASAPANCAFKEPAVRGVAKIIESELPHGRAATYDVDELQTAWFHVRNQREVITNCCNAELAAAEHYFYSRYAVANRDHSPFEMKALIWGYGYFKFLVPKTGNCPKSPDTQGSRDWGYKGVDDAIRDLFFQDLAQNDRPSDEAKQAMGSEQATGSDTGDADSYIGNSPPRVMQAKLSIGASNDPLEQEADRVADQVLAAPTHSAVSGKSLRIQRFAANTSEYGRTAPASIDRVLASPGRPLEPTLQQDMEQRFGHDFSHVRVHSGAAAEQSAQEVNANAYTVGHDVVFGAGRFTPGTHEGRRLIAHELTHVVQQSGADGFRAGQNNQRLARTPITHEQDPFPARQVLRARPESRPEPSRVAASAATVLERQRVAGNQVVAGILQRQDTAPSGPAAAPGGMPVGNAVQPTVEGLLKTFAAAKGYEAQNAAAMDAVRAIIRAYSMSTNGLKTMRFQPDLNPQRSAEATRVEGDVCAPPNCRGSDSEINFGPGSFSQGFAFLVHIVAHELEHVRQNLIGGYHRGDEVEAVSEFLAYTGMVLQVQTVPGAAGRGFLGALKAGTGHSAPALPPLPPDQLAGRAEQVLSMFSRMSSEDQKKPQYRQEFAAAGAKLFERLKTEAPRGLRPPTKFTPEWTPWYEGQAPTLDIFTPEYQEWQDALKSPWNRVKGVWKQFDAAFKVR